MASVLVVGCGLIGTSIGLALRGSDWDDVVLSDRSEPAVDVAVARGAGRRWDGEEHAELAVVSVPPAATPRLLLELQRLDVALTYTHVASVQSHVEREVEASSADMTCVVGGHPLAGREVSGPEGAVADLFVGRPWAVCATPAADAEAVGRVRRLAELCGAVPTEVPAQLHDETVAVTSHLPQALSSALAALVHDRATRDTLPLALSGPALADQTRLAGSSATLWAEILTANAGQIAPLARAVADQLNELAAALEAAGSAAGAVHDPEAATARVTAFLERGAAGRALVPLKRGAVAEDFLPVRVELNDRPGELARLLLATGAFGVNVEDLRLEHVPGRDRGVVELQVSPSARADLEAHLRTQGWHVFMSTI